MDVWSDFSEMPLCSLETREASVAVFSYLACHLSALLGNEFLPFQLNCFFTLLNVFSLSSAYGEKYPNNILINNNHQNNSQTDHHHHDNENPGFSLRVISFIPQTQNPFITYDCSWVFFSFNLWSMNAKLWIIIFEISYTQHLSAWAVYMNFPAFMRAV